MVLKKKVCYILSYRLPTNSRTTVIINALKKIENVELYLAINTSTGLLRYFQTFIKAIKIHFKFKPDFYIIGFRGHEIYWFFRLFFPKSVFIFDEMMSPYDSFVNERHHLNSMSIFSRLFHFAEASILKDADYILTDTILHSQFLSQTFNISSKKIKVIYVGTDESLFKPNKLLTASSSNLFRVFLHASFQPLHGVDFVLKAASKLSSFPIEFTIIGGKGNNNAINKFRTIIKDMKLDNVKHIEWIDYLQLPKMISAADLCLGGPFGGTSQARRVITTKTVEYLAMEKPTVIGYVNESVGFVDRFNCLLVNQANPDELASTILWAYEHQKELTDIAKNGRKLFSEKFSAHEASKSLLQIGAFNARV